MVMSPSPCPAVPGVPSPVAARRSPRSRPPSSGFRPGTLLAISLFLLAPRTPARADQPPAAPPAPVTAPASTAPCTETIPQLYARVSPTVVSITATSSATADPSQRFERVAGSGVLIDRKGLILTNSHVVFGRHALTVTLDDGTALPTRLLGADPLFDVALVEIPLPTTGQLPAAELGSSAHLSVGDDVFAIGNPYGLDQTFTRGIVSAVNRLLPGSAWSLKEPLIQTDAAINPGSSGGALVDRCGRVVGITTAILPEAQSIGFAIPIDLVKSVIPSLLDHGRIVRPWLGVGGQVVPPKLKDLVRMSLSDGFLVETVEPGSPAEAAGVKGGELDLIVSGEPYLLGGDVITEVNGVRADDPERLIATFGSLKVGDKARLTVFREGKTRQMEIALTERPASPGRPQGAPDGGTGVDGRKRSEGLRGAVVVLAR